MSFYFKNLDQKTRNLMLEELELDSENGNLYIGKTLNETGVELYPQLLRAAIEKGDHTSLAESLLMQNCMAETILRAGKPIKNSKISHVTLAEGEFNRFYIRALSRRLLDGEDGKLQVYRAKEVSNPREESIAKIGEIVDPIKLLNDLRSNPGVDTALGLPAGPNSGLSIQIIIEIN